MLPRRARAGGRHPGAASPSHSPRPSQPGRRLATGCLVAAIGGLGAPAMADLDLHVAAGPDGVRPGELIDIEITITNPDKDLRTDVVMDLVIPAGLASIFEAAIDGDCPSSTCDAGEILTFTLPFLPPGGSRTLRYPFAVAGSATSGTILEFPATVSDDGAVEASATTSIVVNPSRTLELSITEDREPASAGERIEYSIGWGLLDSSPGSPGTMLEFPVPAGTSLVQVTGGGQVDGDTITWSLGSLAPGDSGEQRVLVAVDDSTAVGTILDTTATLDNAFGQSVRATSVVPVSADVPLDIRLTASPDPARPGELLDLEITVTNPGAFEVFGVAARLDMPLQASSFFEAEWKVICPSSTCDPQERVLWEIGDLPAGASRTFSLPMQVAGTTASGEIVRFDADVIDSFGFQRSSGGLVRVATDRQLELAVSEDRDPAVAGETITWTLSWGNRSTGAGLLDTRLELPVPAGATFVDATGGGTLDGGVVAWDLGVTPPGASGEERARFIVGDLADGTIMDARASLAGGDAIGVQAETATRVVGDLPLELTVSASPDPAEAGEFLDLEVSITNRGATPRFGIVVLVDVPDEVASFFESLFDGDCPSSTCDPRERVVLSVPELAPGEGSTWTLPVRVAGTVEAGRVIPFEAEVADDTGAIREVASNVLVASPRTADLSLVASDEPVLAGDEVTWTLTWGSRADGDGAAAATAAMRLPAGTSFVRATDGGVLDGDVVRWDLGGVSPGAGGERRVVLAVDPALVPGAILEAEAWFDEGDPSSGARVRFVETTRTAGSAPLDVEVTALKQPAGSDAPLDIALSVENVGGTVREGVVLRLEYATDLDSIFDSTFEGECPSSTCDPGELVVFTIGTMEPGARFEAIVPAEVANRPNGIVINLDADVFDATGLRAHDGDAVMIGTTFRVANPGDVNNDGIVDLFDVLGVLAVWGQCPDADACPEDFTGDGLVGISDLLTVLANFS